MLNRKVARKITKLACMGKIEEAYRLAYTPPEVESALQQWTEGNQEEALDLLWTLEPKGAIAMAEALMPRITNRSLEDLLRELFSVQISNYLDSGSANLEEIQGFFRFIARKGTPKAIRLLLDTIEYHVKHENKKNKRRTMELLLFVRKFL